jgi:tribbles-like protein
MAPEIVAHQTHNYFKADIWALGVILYCLLSGKFPFKSQKDKDLFSKIRKGIFSVPEGITLEAKNTLLSMLQTNPEYRKSTNKLLRDSWF